MRICLLLIIAEANFDKIQSPFLFPNFNTPSSKSTLIYSLSAYRKNDL